MSNNEEILADEPGSKLVQVDPVPTDDLVKRVHAEHEQLKKDIIEGMGIPPEYVDTTASDAVKAHEAYIEDGRARLEQAFRDMFGQYVSLKPREFKDAE